MNCIICDGPTRFLFSKDGYPITGCRYCAHQRAEIPSGPDHVLRTFDDRYFQMGKAGYPGYLKEGPLLRARGRRYARILSRHAGPGRVLDVGAAAGFLLKGFVDSGWEGRGIEPNASMAEHARSCLGLDVATGSFEEVTLDETYDLITMLQLISHLPDLRGAFHKARGLTRPGGLWLIEAWNRESWTARLFGRSWHTYSPPTTVHWFSARGLRSLVGQFGFEEVARGRPSKWILGAHAKSLFRFKFGEFFPGRRIARMLELLPDRLRIPYLGDDIFWALYRKVR